MDMRKDLRPDDEPTTLDCLMEEIALANQSLIAADILARRSDHELKTKSTSLQEQVRHTLDSIDKIREIFNREF